MTLVAGVVFGSSLLGIVLLFILKRYEFAHQTTIGGAWRARADVFALRIKRVLMLVEWYLARTPLLLLALMRFGVRMGALGFARLARGLETRAHQLADLASHKRNFERRETRSTFLKEMGDLKNGNGTEKPGSHDEASQV